MFESNDPNRSKSLPKRIILIRHGESEGNRDNSTYTTIPDHQITLTPQGITQARHAGTQIQRVVSNNNNNAVDKDDDNWRVYFYVSPYVRTRSSLREIAKAFPRKSVIGVREECRIREQDFGNFQVTEKMKDIKESRQKFGRFFYRFPEGESAADVYDRVSMSATLTSSQKILMSSLESFDVVKRNCDAVSTNCMPSYNHLRVELRSCPVSFQIESKSHVFPSISFQMLK
nr:phosphoglycerate mutase-like protein AT74H [Tanacetum cinerariifolium]